MGYVINKTGRIEFLKWPLKGHFLRIWDKIRCTLAALERCTLNGGSFACKIVRGDLQLAAYERGTLNSGDRNCRWDCTVLKRKMSWAILQLKQCFLRKTMSPQPSSFVGYIENYGIKLWRPFKQ